MQFDFMVNNTDVPLDIFRFAVQYESTYMDLVCVYVTMIGEYVR